MTIRLIDDTQQIECDRHGSRFLVVYWSAVRDVWRAGCSKCLPQQAEADWTDLNELRP